MVMATDEKAKQATGDEQGKPKDLPAPGAGLGGKEEVTNLEKKYSQSELNALLGKAGQKLQASNTLLTTERDNFKSQAETLAAEITEARESIASLTKDIEAMSEDDPDKYTLVKLRKEREKELTALKTERAEIAPQKQEIAKFNRDQLVYTVADEFVTAAGEELDSDSFDAFMTAADKFKLSEREGLEALAVTMGLKRKDEVSEETEPGVASVKPYSGKTTGGAYDWRGLSPSDQIKYALEHQK